MIKKTKNILFIFLIFQAFLLAGQDTVFMHTYGIPGYNYGIKTLQTHSGNFMVLGNKSGFTGNTDIYLVLTNPKGEIIRDTAIGGSSIEWANDMQMTSDNGYIITGYTNNAPNNDYNVLVVKTDSIGNVQWSNSYGTSEWDFAQSVIQMPDGSYIIAGETYGASSGNKDILLMGISDTGDSLWAKTYGAAGNDEAYMLAISENHFCYITGSTSSYGAGNYDGFLMKTTATGDSLWMKTLGDTAEDHCYGFTFTSDNAIAIAGSTRNYDAMGLDGTIFKTDTSGNILWKNVFGGTEKDELFSIFQDYNNSYILLGNTFSYGYPGTSDLYLIVADENGFFQTGCTYGLDKYDNGLFITPTSDSGCVITGSTQSLGVGISNIFVIRTDSTYLLPMSYWSQIMGISESIPDNGFVLLYPNPADDKVYFETDNMHSEDVYVKVYDISGKEMYSSVTACKAGRNNITVPLNGFSNGIYIVSLKSLSINLNKRIIIQHP
jgi:hypothetical protein